MHAVGAQRGTCGGHAPARCENQASTKAEFRVPSVFIAGIRDLPAHQIQSARQWYGVCSAARSAAQQHGRRATAEAARRPPTQRRWSWSALTGAEGCAAVLLCDHLPLIKRPLREQLLGYQVGDADDETTRQRGALDVAAKFMKLTFRRCVLVRRQQRRRSSWALNTLRTA